MDTTADNPEEESELQRAIRNAEKSMGEDELIVQLIGWLTSIIAFLIFFVGDVPFLKPLTTWQKDFYGPIYMAAGAGITIFSGYTVSKWRYKRIMRSFDLHCPQCEAPLGLEKTTILGRVSARCANCDREVLGPIRELQRSRRKFLINGLFFAFYIFLTGTFMS